jgi:hypothetical protein
MSAPYPGCQPGLQIAPHRSLDIVPITDRQGPSTGMPGHIFKALVTAVTQRPPPACEFLGGIDCGAVQGQGKPSLTDLSAKL